MGNRGVQLSVLTVAAAATAAPAVADDPIAVVGHEVLYDRNAELVYFEIEFERVPDFYTVDEQNRQHDAFQYWIDTTQGDGEHGPWERLVRGTEIWVGGTIPIRDDTMPTDPTDPYSGGWGPVVDEVPFVLSERTLTFEVTFAALGTTSGAFGYDLATAYFGIGQYQIQGAKSVPIPGPGSLAATACVALAGTGRRRRRA